MSIFKVIVKTEDSILIFFGDKENYREHLSESEKRSFPEDKIVFSKYRIYRDDNIQTIKNKILLTLDFEYCYEELYLFGKEIMTLSDEVIDELLDNSDMRKNIKHKDDVYYVKKLVGHDYDGIYDYSFPVEPYNYKGQTKILYNLENSVLLHYLPSSTTIYACPCADVIAHLDDTDVIKMYYPLLFKEDINSLSKLASTRNKLIQNNKKRIPEELLKLYDCVDAVNNINHLVKGDLDYKEIGVKSFEIALRTQYSIFPLDAIFKCIHSTKDIPYIKYNPGSNRDTFYRLYSDRTAKNGRKVPYLKVSEVLKYSREIGRRQQIALVITKQLHVEQKSLYVVIHKNGQIVVSGAFNKSIDVNEIEVFVKKVFDDVIETLDDYIEPLGYSMNSYIQLVHNNITIKNIQYVYSLKISKKMDLSIYRNLLYSLFLLNETDIDSENGAHLMFKRVNNYISMNAIDEFITVMRKKTEDVQEIVTAVMREMHLNEEDAIENVKDFFGEHKILNGELVDDIGFPVSISLQKSRNILKIVTSNINDIAYIEVLKSYFDAMLKLFQNSGDMEEHIELIKSLTKKKIDETVIEKTKQASIITAVQADTTIDTDFFTVGETDVITGITEDDTFGMMDEEDDEDDTFGMMDEEDDEEISGGGGSDDLKINVTGMKLNSPNPFYARMEKREPGFILKKDSGKFNSYSRTCSLADRRQPVILNKKEMENIEEKHRGSYTDALEYSVKDEPYWYICPRYWSLKDNTSLTEDQVKKITDKEPNAIIPQGVKIIPEGSYIYEFKAPKQHINSKGEYIYQYPGLIHNAHPDGYSVPCCFKRPRKVEAPKKIEKSYNYIVDSIKYPVPEERLGFLPLPAQLFFNNDNKTFISADNPSLLKPEVKCLLRVGSEQNILSSFIGAIASAYAEEHKKTKSIEQMRIIICNSLTLDSFISFNNASFVSIFRSKNASRVDIEPYKKSTLYKLLDLNSKDDVQFFKESVSSFENFLKYIQDDSAFIDHTFLWEIVSEPNLQLFRGGINLVILEIQNGNFHILCPTNPYSQRFFDEHRKTLILLKQGDFYEIVCYQEGKKTPKKMLSNDEPLVKDALEFVKANMEQFCRPKKSLLAYEYDKAIVASVMESELDKHGVVVKSKVSNYQNKVVGLYAGIFIPCLPSSLFERGNKSSIKFVNDINLYKDYETTVRKLNEIYDKCRGSIPCKPMKKVSYEGMVHGIRTNSNQYVKVHPTIPLTEIHDDLTVEHSSDYSEADTSTTLNKRGDKQLEKVKHVHLETQYYLMFRTILRILLNRHENKAHKTKISAIIEDDDKNYESKIRELCKHLEEVASKHVEFKNVNVGKIEEVQSCFRNCKGKSTCNHQGEFCVFEIPEMHLLQPDIENSVFYYVKLADELLRVYSIRAFVLDPNRFLSFSNMNYNVNKDEILLVDALVTHDYFNELEVLNDFVGEINYDIAVPDKLKSQKYVAKVTK